MVEERVRPEREKLLSKHYPTAQRRGTYWWQYAGDSKGLYRAIETLDRVLVMPRVGKTVTPAFVESDQVFSDAVVVFAYDDWFHHGVLSSGFHYRWVVRHASSLRTDTRYTPTDVFETFPQPSFSCDIAEVAETLDGHRRQLMLGEQIGLTSLYNRVHDPAECSGAVRELREWHAELDRAVRDAYGWDDLSLDHGFHDVRGAGPRFTFAPEAADEILVRLLELNQERYLTEKQAGMHERKHPRRRPARPGSPARLFDDESENP